MPHVYAAACAHPEDPQKRRPLLALLALSDDGAELRWEQEVQLPMGASMPMFQALSASQDTLYSVAGPLGVLAYRVDPQQGGRFVPEDPTRLASTKVAAIGGSDGVPSGGGAGPCHISLDRSGSVLLCANYEAPSVAALPLTVLGAQPGEAATGPGGAEPGVAGSRQEKSHPHGVSADPTNRWILASDLGSNCLHVYRWDPRAPSAFGPAASLAGRAALPAGAGPRHVAWAASGRACFVINELDNTIAPYAFEPQSGTLRPLGAPLPTLPADWSHSGRQK